MRNTAPFFGCDLTELDAKLLSRADEVVAMREIHFGEHDPLVIGLRHDVDDNPGAFEAAVKLAHWEAERNYRSTYFVLHHTSYWGETMRLGLEEIVSLGHEVGIHSNAISVALESGDSPHAVLMDAIEELRGWGFDIRGVVGHGDALCGVVGFVNDEQFAECARPEMGAPDRVLTYGSVTLKLDPRPLSDFGLEYESYRSGPRALYLSDSGGRWSESFDGMCQRFPSIDGQLHVLMHPDWWTQAFPVKVAA